MDGGLGIGNNSRKITFALLLCNHIIIRNSTRSMETSILCSVHFEPEDFLKETEDKMGKVIQRELKPNAVPTLFYIPTLAEEKVMIEASGLTGLPRKRQRLPRLVQAKSTFGIMKNEMNLHNF